jgi:hypothetical protein
MRRRLFNLATTISLLLFLLTLISWVRSYWRADSLQYAWPLQGRTQQRFDQVTAFHGQLAWTHQHVMLRVGQHTPVYRIGPHVMSHDAADMSLSGVKGSHELFGFGVARFSFSDPVARRWDTLVLRVPHWFFALLFGLLPVRRIQLRCCASHFRPGHCRGCGYDLRASPDRCPECGMEVTNRGVGIHQTSSQAALIASAPRSTRRSG